MDKREFACKPFISDEQMEEQTINGRRKEEAARVRALKKVQGTKLYIITSNELWPVKIGISLDPVKRLSEIQVGNWIKLHVYRVITFPSNMAFLIEQELHSKLKEKTLSGEWFGVKATDAEQLVEQVLLGHGMGLTKINDKFVI